MSGLPPQVGIPRLTAALAREAAAHPLARKIVIGPRRGLGREILRRLVREGVPWVGFEASTPLALARELVAPVLVEQGLEIADEFDELAWIDTAIDAALGEAGGQVLEPFVQGAGLRAAMAHSIQALRLAGFDHAMLGRAGFRNRAKREALTRVLRHYERLVFTSGAAEGATAKTDTAGVLRLALDSLRAGTIALPPARYLILPGQDRRGLSGMLLAWLIEQGAAVLDDDPAFGLAPPPALFIAPADPGPDAFAAPEAGKASSPANAAVSALAWLHAVGDAPADIDVSSLELFAAGSVSDEVREVFRRVVARGLRWDEVEVVAVDAVAYGAAIDSLARRLGIPVTYAAGLPVGRTRPGRAIAAYLRWVSSDFAEDVLRESIERGDVAPPGGGHGTSGPELARRLRRLRIGRGRERYRQQLDRALARAALPPEEEEDRTAEEVALARQQARLALEDLASILEPVLEATPAVPDRVHAGAAVVSPAALAKGALQFLSLVPVESELDRTTLERMKYRLGRLADVALRPTTLEGAVSVVAAKLDTRVPAPWKAGPAPWSSSGGALHVSDIEYGGRTGRRATFVVGLDAVRFPGGAPHDTLLGDDERRRLLAGEFAAIATTGERLEERRWRLARLLSSLRGHVTLSYSAWEATEARTVAPAAEMLQAFRLLERRPAADYADLHDALRDRASAVPRSGGRLDAWDVWLGALVRDGVVLAGTDVVRAVFPDLDRGLRAAEQRALAPFSPWHGRLRPRPDLDPRGHPTLTLSAKRLETLGTCPLRYLLRYGLGVVPPERVEIQLERWLTPLERGRLLHAVYQRTLERARARGLEPDAEPFADVALEALEAELTKQRQASPPPGEAVYGVEAEQLREDVLAFVEMTRSRGAPWVQLELRFGQGERSDSDAVILELPGGPIRVTGAIDRIDRAPDGLVVIDYKTGSAEPYGRPHAVFHGGRRLQHALYSAVTRRLVGDVARAEYHFPTHRGETRVSSFEERQLRRARRIIDALLEMVANGHFVPTDDPADCRHCDYREVCRVRETNGRIESPMTEWSATTDAPELHVLRRLRRPVI